MLTLEQLEMRRRGITGTDIGAILGLSEHRSALDVWADKTGSAPVQELTPALKRGMYLEDGVLRWYEADTHPIHIERCGTIPLAHEPLIMATPDAVAYFETSEVIPKDQWLGGRPVIRCGIEVKCPGRYAETGWGEPGTDQVPQSYLAQAIFEMAVLDVERLDFAALLGGELRIYPVKRDRDLEGLLIEKALQWWRDHVVANRPPEPTARVRDVEWVARRFPRSEAEALEWNALTPMQRLKVEEWLGAKEAAKRAADDAQAAELGVKLILQGAEGLVGVPDHLRVKRIDWKSNATGPVSWGAAFSDLAGQCELSPDAIKELVSKHTGAPARPLVVRKAKKGEE